MPVIPFEVDSISDFVAKPHSKNLAPLNQNKLQKKPDQLTLEEPNPVWTVSELTRSVRLLLEGSFRMLVVEGELSNVHQASSGHWYFVIKDEHSQLRGILFKQAAMRLSFVPEEGMAVWARGSLQVYEQRGEYQINVTGLEPKGAGALQMAYEQLRKKLLAEGLFEADRKRKLPFLPKAIGVVTSPTGAVIQDMLKVLKRRFPDMRLILFPSIVQGPNAPSSLVKGIEWLNEQANEMCLEVLIICRGGGSLEDLWAFNDENLARAVAKSKLPVISAVGHETDFTITDFVADVRAATPSVAMELAVPSKEDLVYTTRNLFERLCQQITHRLIQTKKDFSDKTQRLNSPKRALKIQRERIEDLAFRLKRSRNLSQRQIHESLTSLTQRLMNKNPKYEVMKSQNLLDEKHHRISRAISVFQNTKQQKLHELISELDALSPLSVLNRGFSVIFDQQQKIIKSVQQVNVGQTLQLKLHDGKVLSRVDKIFTETPFNESK
ncbi:MAG: exodeoxyribonuclease VII large subunit [Deltaproteobacteria bacterium]|nr:exodeoxyribonuclease VII large subunit [Deltaproteobacteria bacterium]